jgi:hypothetical protein
MVGVHTRPVTEVVLLTVMRLVIAEGLTRNRGPSIMIPGACWLAAVVPLSGSPARSVRAVERGQLVVRSAVGLR